MERRKAYNKIEFIFEASYLNEKDEEVADVSIKLGNGFEIKTTLPYNIYAEQRLGVYEKVKPQNSELLVGSKPADNDIKNSGQA